MLETAVLPFSLLQGCRCCCSRKVIFQSHLWARASDYMLLV
jgi:hypothetical protein